MATGVLLTFPCFFAMRRFSAGPAWNRQVTFDKLRIYWSIDYVKQGATNVKQATTRSDAQTHRQTDCNRVTNGIQCLCVCGKWTVSLSASCQRVCAITTTTQRERARTDPHCLVVDWLSSPSVSCNMVLIPINSLHLIVSLFRTICCIILAIGPRRGQVFSAVKCQICVVY